MKKTELYNRLSEKLVKGTMLKPGEQVVYRLHNMQKNPMDPTKLAIPSAKNVPPIDTIWDEETQQYIDIAAVRTVAPTGEHTFHEIFFYGNQAGHMILVGGRALDQEVHSYLSLCNYNASNPNRDTTKEAIFERVDEEAKAVKESRTRNVRREALNAAADLSPEDVKEYTAALGKDDTRPVSVLRNDLEEMADKTPEEFMQLINNKQAVMKATINRALKKGVIVFSQEQSRFEWPNQEAILTVARSTGSDAVDELVSFCVSSTKGDKVFQTISSKAKK
jgi:hypothetical protein